MRIGIDSGGTFTDFVILHDDGHLESFKLRSNPAAPDAVILEGLARIAANRAKAARADVVHGSTVATNALLERKGARTAFVTTHGFEDIVAIGRQNRPELYNLTPALPPPLVPRDLCFGAEERILFYGSIHSPLRAAAIEKLRRQLRGIESVAICLLHSYQNDAHERALLDALDVPYVCASCEISPEFREYERASTTVINAYVGPLMDRYLARLEAASPHPVAIMQSNGGLLTTAEARLHAVRTILSGPAGGIVGAVEIARLSGFKRALTFDMGGTSTDVALAGIHPRLTTEARIGDLPVRVPMLDIHTVGAGGGSIARVDHGGSLRVGPESAGSIPGPACYGQGTEATVTDAHVVLGRIGADQLVGGEMHLDPPRSEAAVARIASALGLKLADAAAAIIRVANSNMERAIRAVSVERGEDPRDFPLVAFGGSGGLHACELADDLGVTTVIVPRLAGALSALGMLLADRTRDYSAGALGATPRDIESRYRKLETQARKDMRRATLQRFADLRYAGQSYELTVPWSAQSTADGFHKEHHRLYGYSNPARAVEVVTLRLRATLSTEKPALREPRRTVSGAVPVQTRRVHIDGRFRQIPAISRDFPVRQLLRGPALITDYGSTTLIPAGWSIRKDARGSLILRRT